MEDLKVGIELAAGVVPEPSGYFADNEAEYGRAEYALYLGDTNLRHTGLAEGGVDGLAGHPSLLCGGGTLEQERKDTRVAMGRGSDVGRHDRQALAPWHFGGGRRKFGEQLFDEAVEKIGLVRDVAIEGHRRHREALGYRGHGDRIKALFVGEGNG